MIASYTPLSLFLLAIGAFLILDSILALVFGSRYLLWGLERTPAFYQAMILRLSQSSHLFLLGVKLAEFAAGFILFRFAGRLSG